MRAFFAIFFLTLILSLFLPWWSALIPGFLLGAWLFERGIKAFLTGFFGAGSVWFLQALYIDVANSSILSVRIADMMQAGSPWVLILVTFLIGGLLGGFGALCGVTMKTALKTSSADTTI